MTEARVLVVEDSLTIRKHIVGVLSAAEGLRVVGEAGDGRTAIELCDRLQPDVITMDMMLPVMTGLSATEYIMAYAPRPILIVSASTNRGELFKTYDALAAGAVDVLEKPSADRMDDAWERELVARVRMVSRIRVITHPRGRLGRLGRPRSPAPAPGPRPQPAPSARRVLAIGASTGGPAAVLATLDALPPDLGVPILVVMHISDVFAGALADWLDAQTAWSVKFAEDRERLPEGGSGKVLMAPAGRHLVLEGSRLRLTDDPERHSCRPSVDVLFESLARELGDGVVACLLTGMGKDGARGLLDVRRVGGLTIAQDEATSIVYGMPGEAVAVGAAGHVLPLGEIPGLIVRATGPEVRP